MELIGKYMIDSPEVAGDYYQKIADRIAVSRIKHNTDCFFPDSITGHWPGRTEACYQVA